MIVYLATKAEFRADILFNRIEEKILDSFRGVLGKSVGDSGLASWRNSLPYMDRVLDDPGNSPTNFTAMNHLEQILSFST